MGRTPGQVVARESVNRYTIFFDDRTTVVNVEKLKPYFSQGGSRGPTFPTTTTPVAPLNLADPAPAPEAGTEPAVPVLPVFCRSSSRARSRAPDILPPIVV